MKRVTVLEKLEKTFAVKGPRSSSSSALDERLLGLRFFWTNNIIQKKVSWIDR